MTECELFTEALLRPKAEERAAYLDEACGADTPVRRRLDHLLALHETGRALLDGRAADLLEVLGEDTEGAHAPEETCEAGAGARQLLPYLSPAARPDALGRLGHYEVLRELGHGGFGIVVKAHDETLQRVVAIKVLAPHLAATSPPRKRFLREARSAAAVRHQHVVQIYAVEEQPLPYLVMEFIDGQTLQQRLDATGPLEPAEVVRIGQQIALGLAAAHEKGLIHRDVKPANILLEAGVECRVKLTDFGLARTGDDASLTQSGVIAGSPMYMAPEQAAGAALDHRADLFSLGSVLYAMATGRPPFRASSTLGVLKRVAEDTPRPVREVVADVPEGLCVVIARLLEKKPADRFATAQAAAQALAHCLHAAPVPAPRLPARRLPAALAVATLLLAAAGLWFAFGLVRPAGEEAPPVGPADTPDGYVVRSTADDGSPGTLRWAIDQANVHHGEDAITFDPAVFDRPKTITLTQGPLLLADPARTTITGPAAGLTLSGGRKSQVFVVGAANEPGNPARAWIADLTIADGRANDEFDLGGGVLCRGGAELTLTGCTLRDNESRRYSAGGGGVFNKESTVDLTNCTLTRNRAFEGGGVKNYEGVLRVTNCTFAGNSAADGGADIWSGGPNGTRTEVYNSVFADAAGGALFQCDAPKVTGDHNLATDGTAPGAYSLLNTKAWLGPLGRYGGPTETLPLLTGSPALNAGDNARVPGGVRTDQRGLPRIAGGKIDIGAFEVQ